MSDSYPNLIGHIELSDAIEKLEKIIDHEEAEGYMEVPPKNVQSPSKDENYLDEVKKTIWTHCNEITLNLHKAFSS